ncbi:uncharacterized protein LOC105444289 [Strongylocentrotus purpuratus]|uniref:Uncharacterized protein n=1 Tax=Strongylocentrotus purpuratus TaxID=7668 RepID=A0A7M7T3G4_STRPU|nr:uncharacterized protein LOC105444289 [Strongylocentrotus purpuratus]
MARLSILLLLVAISYVHTSEGSYIGESLCGLCSNLWRGCHQWITSCFKKGAPAYTANYDKLTLVYEWGPSLCKKRNACTIPSTAKQIWTIHGLWPFKSNLSNIPKHSSTSSPPINCNGTYDRNALSSTIRAKLNEKWPNIETGGTND